MLKYEKEQACFDDILKFRELWGNKFTTMAKFEETLDKLGAMYLRCPDSIRTMVYATLNEGIKRKTYKVLAELQE